MKSYRVLVMGFAALLLSVFVACSGPKNQTGGEKGGSGDGGTNTEMMPEKGDMGDDMGGGMGDDDTMAQKIIQEIKGYDKWDFFPGLKVDKDGFVEGQKPHGKYIRVFVNKKDDLNGYGSIIIKENYTAKDKGSLKTITLMKKIKGYDDKFGDWFWLRLKPDMTVDSMKGNKLRGKVQVCGKCHSNAGGGDFIYLNDK